MYNKRKEIEGNEETLKEENKENRINIRIRKRKKKEGKIEKE